ncbi:SDR family NAD(P)-dependent oxidoreductase [Demequina activiva]|uniref:3-oxoacyl-ACP reductase n=1 Tax=Demequina activiva TaxID=1582364 RepID=A0A919Q1W4_9MICO|nr:SDR family oxidoreductase [Demequina activiva]GIG54765.1 3-oxoacyl-ACP reductase [Demequina activiva]
MSAAFIRDGGAPNLEVHHRRETLMSTRPLALITGGSRGLGRATALALASQGVDVVITYRTGLKEADAVVAVAREHGAAALALELDVSDPDAIAAFAEALPHALRESCGRDRLDHLVNNAGHGTVTPMGQTDADTIDHLYAVHFRGPYLLTQALEPMLVDGGAIINLSSGLARFAVPGQAAYGALKAGVDHLTWYWAKELGPRGIRVNSVAPGPVATDFGGGRNRDNEQQRQFLAAQTALGRVGEPEDIGPLIATLLTGATGWVTGQRIEASGGIFL